MRPSGRILGSFVLAPVLALVLAASALASSTYTYTLSGFETSATSNVGTFAGTASTTDDQGTWSASVDHSTLTKVATITGGSFTYNGVARSVTASFTGGSLTQISGFRGCTNQQYAVIGVLTIGTFTATLTHFRAWVFGRCIVYWATVTGTAQLTF